MVNTLEFIPEKKFMLAAIDLADKALENGEIPVGAVVEKNGVIIGKGMNRRETDKNPVMHAEIEAIQEASRIIGDWRLSGCNLYVTLEPCPMCMGAVLNSRIDRVIFGAEDARTGSCGSALNLLDLPAYKKVEVFRGFMETECKKIILDFFKELRT